MFDFTFIGMVNIMTKVWRAKNVVTKYLTAHIYVKRKMYDEKKYVEEKYDGKSMMRKSVEKKV